MKEKLVYNENLITQFLEESNKIEGVYDGDSLDQAIYAWEYLSKEKEMNIGVVLKTHKILMLHQKLYPNEKGYFRKCQIWIGGREGIDWKLIPKAMEVWCKKVNLSKTEEEIKQDHIKFEKCHSFVDGNGRLGRLLMTWQRLQVGLPIQIIYESEKYKYYEWFK